MLGQPVYFLTPDVVGVHLHGRLARRRHGDRPRPRRHGDAAQGARSSASSSSSSARGRRRCSVTDRATIANMAPEYGATMGFFPVDEETCRVPARDRPHRRAGRRPFAATTRRRACSACRARATATTPRSSSSTSATVAPSVAGPKRPQDRIDLPDTEVPLPRAASRSPSPRTATASPRPTLSQSASSADPRAARPSPGGGSQASSQRQRRAWRATRTSGPRARWPTTGRRRTASARPARSLHGRVEVGHGDVLIAAITSCTNTSNPSVMLAAGLLARKAVERGLSVSPRVKTSLAPGSRVVTEYLDKTGLQPYLDQLGFDLVGYGCTTCIGNSGPLDAGHRRGGHEERSRHRQRPLRQPQLRGARAPVDPGELPHEPAARRGVRARRPRGHRPRERAARPGPRRAARLPARHLAVQRRKSSGPARLGRRRRRTAGSTPTSRPRTRCGTRSRRAGGTVYAWDAASTYIQEPPFFEGFTLAPPPVDDDARAPAPSRSSATR